MRILLTNKWMRNLGGSELVTLELAEWFQHLGHEVLIYTEQDGGVLDITVPYTTKRPDPNGFDLLWIHHNMLIHELGFRKRMSQRIVFNHMSMYVGLELPRIPTYEMALADVILANSAETREALEWRGLSGVQLFQNPAPRKWDTCARGSGLLLVSNHRPVELIGVPGDRIGGDRPIHLTPELLSDYGAVVCNGKSVQYAMRAGLPVYLYDHFGGCGWLTAETMDTAERFNFSGRGFGVETEWRSEVGVHRSRINRKTHDEILKELATVPEPLLCPDRFKLEFRLKELGIC